MLAVGFAVALLVDVVFPVLVAIYLRRRFGVAWRFFLYGAAIFFVFQIVTRIPIVQVLAASLGTSLQAREVQILWIAALSLSAGVFEEVGRWVGYRWLFRPEDRSWRNALMYGAGHGGIESILLVGILGVLNSLLAVLTFGNADLNTLGLTQQQIAQVEALLATQAWLPLLGAIERIGSVVFHIALSVIVLQAFTRRSLNWLWLAIGLHGLANFVIVMTNQYVGVAAGNPVVGNVASEVMLVGVALLALGIIRRLRPASDEASPVAA